VSVDLQKICDCRGFVEGKPNEALGLNKEGRSSKNPLRIR